MAGVHHDAACHCRGGFPNEQNGLNAELRGPRATSLPLPLAVVSVVFFTEIEVSTCETRAFLSS